MKPTGELQPLLLPEPLIQQSNSWKHAWCGIKGCFHHLLEQILCFHPDLLLNPTVGAVGVRCLLLPWLQGLLCPSRVWAQLGLSGSNFGDLPRSHHSAVPAAGSCCVVLLWVFVKVCKGCSGIVHHPSSAAN